MIAKNTNLLYKYTALNEFTFKNLLLSQLWFNPPDKMNDQLEGLVKVKNTEFNPSKRAIKNFIIEHIPPEGHWDSVNFINEKGFIEFYMSHWYRSEPDQFRISSFSNTPIESLMWAHYADKHAGICLIYDRMKLLKSLKTNDVSFQITPVKYGVKPIITLIEQDYQIIYNSDIPIYSAKDSNWKYEKEIRIYIEMTKKDNLSPYGESYNICHLALKGIIYGYKMTESDKDAISMIFRNDPYYAKVKEFNEKIDFKSGKIYIEPD